jgi:hypothetical protein
LDTIEHKFKGHAKSKAWPEFVKDVYKAVVNKIKFARKAGPNVAGNKDAENEALKNKLRRIADIIQDAWGQSFPDGDPADIIIPKLRKLGIDTYDAMDWMNKAARRVMGYKSYNDFLSISWEKFKGDNPDRVDDYGLHNNPWEPTR